MLDQNKNYIIDAYQRKSEFSSFLPGISGERGIPMWCYYTNRGQAVSCFGVQDKDHSIMEFYPAHQAYERAATMGFRTFLKIDGKFVEAFADPFQEQKMRIGMNSLIIEEETDDYRICVEYETLPMEPLAGLMRSVTVESKMEGEHTIEVVDGLPELIPYGVSATTMKEMGQTAKAWMQVLDRESKCPKFKVRASMEDTAEVSEVTGMNYAVGKEKGKSILPVIVDRSVLFGFDQSLRTPYEFAQHSITTLLKQTQVECNDVPCCFFVLEKTVKKDEVIVIQEIYGMSEEQEAYDCLLKNFESETWFEEKQILAKQLVTEMTDRIHTETGNDIFDSYCRQNYLDNLLRGGYPVKIGEKQVFYLYSRKHGDMERDYNFFSMLPEYYSQGNGNFRDVNQNRRCDVQFSPFVGESAIKTFYNALQINGYNPLVIEKMVYQLSEQDVCTWMNEGQLSDETKKVLQGEFTPGILYRTLEKGKENADEWFQKIMDQAQRVDKTKYGEGHWSDHWTYNLDLVESYLSIFPEQEERLLYLDESYVYAQAEKQILPRRQRYVKTEKGIRQYHFLKKNVDTSLNENTYLKNKNGNVVYVNLMAKMFTLLANKVSALDPYGMGIEMEGGKPGWYDALNGLPGLLGSSMAEAYETLRMAYFMRTMTDRYTKEFEIPIEVATLQSQLLVAYQTTWNQEARENVAFWNAINDAKECFWEESAKTLSGESVVLDYQKQKEFLDFCILVLERGVDKAFTSGKEVCPTYFYYDVTAYEETGEELLPTKFEMMHTPDFLEGSVHAFKLAKTSEQKEKIYKNVKNSHLYDEPLKMYKVNASLCEATYELGRASAFTPGWLENESVWLHMEYKYLLELLKAGLYKEFREDFKNAAIPFLSEEVYGRSLLENSSFIASSVNPNEKIRGKGFVARLSGSTAEFLQIWQIMMFGKTPVKMVDGELQVELEPMIPAYIVGEKKKVICTFLGNIEVVYELSNLSELIPGEYKVQKIQLTDKTGNVHQMNEIKGEMAQAVRKGEISKMEVSFETCM